jgi:hypothetical protein
MIRTSILSIAGVLMLTGLSSAALDVKVTNTGYIAETCTGDDQAPNSYIFYGDPLIDTILGESAEKLSEIAGYCLLPTYTYTRLYGKGDELLIHNSEYLPENERWIYFIQDKEFPEYVNSYGSVRRKVIYKE